MCPATVLARSAGTVPVWSPWTDDEANCAAWFGQFDEFFVIWNYMPKFSYTDQRAMVAGNEVLVVVQGQYSDSCVPSRHAAEGWQRRAHLLISAVLCCRTVLRDSVAGQSCRTLLQDTVATNF